MCSHIVEKYHNTLIDEDDETMSPDWDAAELRRSPHLGKSHPRGLEIIHRINCLSAYLLVVKKGLRALTRRRGCVFAKCDGPRVLEDQ
jgi:hypothetical protein